jgi:hypothetical protein
MLDVVFYYYHYSSTRRAANIHVTGDGSVGLAFCYFVCVILKFEQRDKLSTCTGCCYGWVTFWVGFLDL